MFVRFTLVYSLCLVAAGSFFTPEVTGQWKPVEPAQLSTGQSDVQSKISTDVKFRPSPHFQTVQLPAPIDKTAQGTVAPITYHVARPAVRGQDAAQLQTTIGQNAFVQTNGTQPNASQPIAAQSVSAQANIKSNPTPGTLFQPPASAANNVIAHTATPLPNPADVPTAASAAVQQAASFTSGNGTLPNEHGQVWREYDISPYTLRMQGVENPQQAIIDRIIVETGTQVWFTEPLGMLNANQTTLRVYHTPQMQEVVKGVVDRFVGGQTDAYAFGVRLLTINNPNWRESLHRIMRPVTVQTPGIQAWIMSKEDAALLVSELSKRTDYREYHASDLIVYNGQSAELTHVKPTSYIKNILFSGDAFGSYQPELGEIREGYDLSINPLTAIENNMPVVDCVIKCKVDQVERLVDVDIDVPTQLNPGQKVQVQVPQLVSWRVHERFIWPADHVLVVSCGVVAKPGATKRGLLGMRNVPNPFEGAPRADAMMILEAKGTTAAPLAAQAPTGNSSPVYQTGAITNQHGRY